MDGHVTIDSLKDRLVAINDDILSAQAKADAESRDLTEVEQKNVDGLFAEFEKVNADVARRERVAKQTEMLEASMGRKSDADAIVEDARDSAVKAAATPRDPFATNRGGFTTFGEFALAVAGATQNARVGGSIDPRLLRSAATTVGTEKVGQDGGFLVPPEWRNEIMKKVVAENELMQRTFNMPTSKNSIVLNTDETTPWDASGGIQAEWLEETGTLSQSKPKLQQKQIRLHKLGALVNVSEELLDDAPAMASYLTRHAPEKLVRKVNEAIVRGDGNGKPLGILSSDALISTAAESGQAAATIQLENVINMYSRLYAPFYNTAAWFINQDIIPQLYTMGQNNQNVFIPNSSAANAPHGMLLGRPIIPTVECSALGTVGDIILADMTQYLTSVKSGGVKSDVSIHLYFDQDVTAFRFVMRVAGQPLWNTAITPPNSAATKSWAVALATRS